MCIGPTTIDNIDTGEQRGAPAHRHHAALHRANQALARWRSGASLETLQAAQALPTRPQLRWHRAVQEDFLAWLEAGGFGQQEQ
jgi:hypothetical protein